MKVKDSSKFLDDKTELAGIVTEPKASGRLRACEEEYDVCLSPTRSLTPVSEFWHRSQRWIAENGEHDY